MENTQQTNLSINESVKTLTEMGYTSFSKRIVNHSEFADNFDIILDLNVEDSPKRIHSRFIEDDSYFTEVLAVLLPQR